MDWTRIVYVLIVFVIIYYLLSWFLETSVKLTGVRSGKTMEEIEASKTITKKSNFAYSIWFNIADWSGEGEYGRTKQLFQKGRQVAVEPMSNSGQTNGVLINTYFKKYENNLVIQIAYNTPTVSGDINYHDCEIFNIPLQKWVNIIISLNTKVLDVYMNGKLVKTCIMPRPPNLGNSTEKVFLTPNNGFSGETANFRFFSDSLNPQEAWNVYKSGYGSGILSALLNKYKLKVAFLKDNVEHNSFII